MPAIRTCVDAANCPIFKNILYSSRSDAYVWLVSHMPADRPGPASGCYVRWQSHITSLMKYESYFRGRSLNRPRIAELLVVFQGAGVAFGEA